MKTAEEQAHDWVVERMKQSTFPQYDAPQLLNPQAAFLAGHAAGLAEANAEVSRLLGLVERARQVMGHLFFPEYEEEAKHHMKQLLEELEDMESAKGGE